MQDLRLIGVHEDGEHLLLSDADGGRFRVRVDEPLRAAVRHDRPRLGQQQVEADAALRPRDVQALIRAGSSAEEVAERSGWSVEKVRRYEGPIVAEREHVAGLSRGVRVRGRSSGAGAPTLSVRVGERLKGRGVDPAAASWDAWREEGGPWTVVVTFAAGGRQRQASWHFDLADRTVTAIDDEARWLSEEEEPAPGPIPAPHLSVGPSRSTTVYDVEAEGGVRATQRPAPAEPEALGGPDPGRRPGRARARAAGPDDGHARADHRPRPAPRRVAPRPAQGPHQPPRRRRAGPRRRDAAGGPGLRPRHHAPAAGGPRAPRGADPLDARPEPEAAAWAEAAGAALDQPDDGTRRAGTGAGRRGVARRHRGDALSSRRRGRHGRPMPRPPRCWSRCSPWRRRTARRSRPRSRRLHWPPRRAGRVGRVAWTRPPSSPEPETARLPDAEPEPEPRATQTPARSPRSRRRPSRPPRRHRVQSRRSSR